MHNISNNRFTMYLSPRKDKDIRIELEGVESGDINWFVKELIRDGIKYRKGGNTINVTPLQYTQSNNFRLTTTSPMEVSRNDRGVTFDDLLNMEISRKEFTNIETEEMFDKL